MDVEVTTSNPYEVDGEEIRDLLEAGGYRVASVVVLDRSNVEWHSRSWREHD